MPALRPFPSLCGWKAGDSPHACEAEGLASRQNDTFNTSLRYIVLTIVCQESQLEALTFHLSLSIFTKI